MKKAAYLGLNHQPQTAHMGKEYATVQDITTESFTFPSVHPAVVDPLTDVLRQGAKQMLIKAVEAEAAAWIDEHTQFTDELGHRQVVRNGHADPRTVVTGVGPMQVTMPRVHDRRPPPPEGVERERFTSKILPPYLRIGVFT